MPSNSYSIPHSFTQITAKLPCAYVPGIERVNGTLHAGAEGGGEQDICPQRLKRSKTEGREYPNIYTKTRSV
jgi:hypothetical protein